VYDLPSTLFYGDYSMALPISGRTDGLSRRRWLDFAESIDLARPAAERVIDELLLHTVDLCDEIDGGVLPFAQKALRDASRNMTNRRKLLQP
jgi:serine/threonine-protein kinase HipA